MEQTAREIISHIEWSRLSRTTLVLPSHRAGVVLKDALLRLQKESHAPAVWAPQVRTLTQLQDELSPLYAEDELFTIIRLYKHLIWGCSGKHIRHICYIHCIQMCQIKSLQRFTILEHM